jgi:hypothetical protein
LNDRIKKKLFVKEFKIWVLTETGHGWCVGVHYYSPKKLLTLKLEKNYLQDIKNDSKSLIAKIVCHMKDQYSSDLCQQTNMK